jgi:hypothetical protein
LTHWCGCWLAPELPQALRIGFEDALYEVMNCGRRPVPIIRHPRRPYAIHREPGLLLPEQLGPQSHRRLLLFHLKLARLIALVGRRLLRYRAPDFWIWRKPPV